MSKYKVRKNKEAMCMLKERRSKQEKMDLVILEQMIPADHLLRKICLLLP